MCNVMLSSSFSQELHRITDVWGGRDLQRSFGVTPCPAGSTKTHCPGLDPDRFWISPGKKTPQPLCAYPSVQSLLQSLCTFKKKKKQTTCIHHLLQYVPIACCSLIGYCWRICLHLVFSIPSFCPSCSLLHSPSGGSWWIIPNPHPCPTVQHLYILTRSPVSSITFVLPFQIWG